MRVRRYLLAIAMVTTGAVIARPDDVIPLASKLAAALRATPAPAVEARETAVQPAPARIAHDLPAFVTTSHDLKIPEQKTAPDAGRAQQIEPIVTADDPSPSATGATPAAGSTGPGAGETGSVSSGKTAALNIPEPVDNSLDASGKPQKVAADADNAEAETAVVGGHPIIPAKKLFGAAKAPSPLAARAIGTYSRGCVAGAVALPVDGPAWQAMRLSRNRNWGHPKLIDLVERLAVSAQKNDGWPGLLVGDISQPRGGPMLTGHASHQLGLDADIWLTPMPDRKLSRDEREKLAATSMLDKTDLAVDPKVFTDKHAALIKRAASFPEVERVLVHPAIKKALCQSAGTDRGWLGKVRPIQGHYYHFHVRIGCPPGSVGCVSQKPITGEDGCTKEVDDWLARMARAKLPPPPKPPGWKPPPPTPPVSMAQLPAECKMVLENGPGGVPVPPEAMLPPPAPPKAAGKQAKKHEPLVKATVTLRPAKDRRASAGDGKN